MEEVFEKNKVDEMKEKYGKVYQVKMTLEPDDDTQIELDYIFMKPKTASFERYMKNNSNGMVKALRRFMLDNIVEEQRERLEADMEEYPALTLSVGEKFMYMLGLAKDTNLTKL